MGKISMLSRGMSGTTVGLALAGVLSAVSGYAYIPYPFHGYFYYRFAFWGAFLMTQPVVWLVGALSEAGPGSGPKTSGASFIAKYIGIGVGVGTTVGYLCAASTFLTRCVLKYALTEIMSQ